ncbi:hypothetical protein C1T17_01625 [Sphingobium sp. SCG-1]|uniref:extracellular catalytic domain type 1 short-chain-length polyhydroxyalkanoate depolymerase n=1 Tax=Sphingobium sp. SCG-1 TaxID=2072936 RepID=UPI000CD68203|nr:PHB depolymerase family esterase [Sphingobium sp. SCG-1]AUW56970.1 hypothetical protein C1T17_01625 [Sphingobium sp. SCG-1]
MAGLASTLKRLAKSKLAAGVGGPINDRLSNIEGFGSNPGNLGARYYVPDALSKAAPLVVVLHGCTQTAAGYDHGSGWSALADQYGFALLFPEQRRGNNMNLCFNWFSPDDTRRDAGEMLSIRQMIDWMIETHRLDIDRIFVTGLSAGGAMTSSLLASYPELFKGGAIIAGLPHGTASSVPEALERMRGQGGPQGEALARLIAPSESSKRLPSIAIWHGSGDQTVAVSNAQAIIDQWLPLHGLGRIAPETDVMDGHSRRIWRNGQGETVVEEHIIAGMAHGTPLSTAEDARFGNIGPYMLEAGTSSTLRIAQSWGIVPPDADFKVVADPHAKVPSSPQPHREAAQGVQEVIEGALKAAGLMR